MDRIAIIGTGIAGMGAAYFLRDRHDITLYERNNYAGGHTNTVTVKENGRDVHIDTGFMVYNETTYPNLTRLFRELSIVTKPTPMSFSVQHKPTGLEYRGTGLNNLFCQRKTVLNPGFIKMLFDVDRFSKEADEVLRDNQYQDYTLSRYVFEKRYGQDFLQKFLAPMSSAVWSTPPGLILDFPVTTLVRFFKNHGFLGLKTQHPWYTVHNGSRMYRDKIMSLFKGRVRLNNGATKVLRSDREVIVEDSRGERRVFDKVVLACHADEAYQMLDNPSDIEKRLLSCFQYQKNKATLHTDPTVMPRIKQAWSSWNYRIDLDWAGQPRSTIIYDMNSLQQVSDHEHYFVSINDPGLIDADKVLWETEYTHPVYSVQAARAQNELGKLNTQGNVYFCGSYFKYGFHEDALTSGIEAVKAITGQYPKDYTGFPQ